MFTYKMRNRLKNRIKMGFHAYTSHSEVSKYIIESSFFIYLFQFGNSNTCSSVDATLTV